VEIRTTDKGRDHLRELFIDGEPVSRLTVIDHHMRIGSAHVRLAGIGDVHTSWEHRLKGHMRALMEDSLDYMLDGGYDVSMLFGIRDFYHRFGYAVCLPEHKVVLQTRDAEEAGKCAPAYTVHPVAPEDMAAIVRLYNRSNAERTCSIVRDPASATTFPKGSRYGRPADCFLLRDEAGSFGAYAAYDRSTQAVNIVEVESRDPSLYPALLYEFAKMAIERRCGHISLHFPPDHPFAEYVERYGCEWSTERPKSGGGVGRIINQGSLLNRIGPELQRRARRCGAALPEAVEIRTDLGKARLPIYGDTREVPSARQAQTWVELSQDRLMQLITGARSARDVLNDPQVHASDGAESTLKVLFPKNHPYTWLADRF
jgi:predicted acetyltransferase